MQLKAAFFIAGYFMIFVIFVREKELSLLYRFDS
jgi:hypothetical protein